MYSQTVSPIIDQSAVYTPKLYLKNAVIYMRQVGVCILGVKSYNKYNCIRMTTLFTLTEISLKFRFIPKDEVLFSKELYATTKNEMTHTPQAN